MRASLSEPARDGVMRLPGAPSDASETSVRMTIHPPAGGLVATPLLRRRKLPVYSAPGARRRTSPGRAASSAAWRLAPARTRMARPPLGYFVSTVARGSSALAAVPPACAADAASGVRSRATAKRERISGDEGMRGCEDAERPGLGVRHR